MVLAPKIEVQKVALFTLELPLAIAATVWCQQFIPSTLTPGPTISVLSGLHGNEFDGGYICYRLAQFLQNLPHGWELKGTVQLIPNANPLGTNLSQRSVGFTPSDLNRTFPGDAQGNSEEQMAAALFEATRHSELCIDIHSSNEFLLEVPQVRIVDRPQLRLLAQELGLDIIWTHTPQNWIGGTLAKALHEVQTPTLVVEMGAGCRLHQPWSERVVQGILHLWVRLGVLRTRNPLPLLPLARIADENNVLYVNAPRAGLLILETGLQVGFQVQAGQKLGQIIQPATLTQTAIYAPIDGYLFTLRVHPLVYEGSLVARLVRA